ncbi:hypothetical protein [Streptomyces sp. NPDC002588]|uniref:hypothetical protein n=1 Tax=Streptomyces sp. NPDC002588 TaxID=3154419 RepID=UPI0033306715
MSRSDQSGVSPEEPAAYQPYAEVDPSSYERYSDPAAAHGWQNAYDETQRLPAVAPAEEGAPAGRADRRRAARRAGAGRPSRRVLAAAGAAGVVSAAALVASVAFTSGSPTGEQRGKHGDTRTAPGTTVSGPASASPSATGSASVRSATSTGVDAAPSSPATTSTAPSAASPSAPAGIPAPTTTTSAPSSDRGKGKPGWGRTKGPR